MPNYFDGKIYKLHTDGFPELVYIGATTQPLCNRLTGYVSSFSTQGTEKNYPYFKILEKGSYHITLVENYPCNNKEELNARKQYHIENNDCINKSELKEVEIKKESYYETNKERIKAYYEANKDKLIERQKAYYRDNKDKYVEYRMEHQEKIAEYKKKWRIANRDKVNSKRTVCKTCKVEVSHRGLSQHIKSKKHLNTLCAQAEPL